RDVLVNTLKTSNAGNVQNNLFNILGPGGLKILGDTNHDNTININDVSVTQANNGNDITIGVRLTRAPQDGVTATFDLGLALQGAPGQITSQNNVQVQVGFDYDALPFGVHNSNQFFFDAPTPNELKLTGDAPLVDAVNPPIEGPAGFLPFTATDDAN